MTGKPDGILNRASGCIEQGLEAITAKPLDSGIPTVYIEDVQGGDPAPPA